MDNAFGIKGKDGQWLVAGFHKYVVCDSLKSAMEEQEKVGGSVIYRWLRVDWFEYPYQ